MTDRTPEDLPSLPSIVDDEGFMLSVIGTACIGWGRGSRRCSRRED
jgi:hypothetical protein